MTVRIELPEEESELLNAKATAEGLTTEECAKQLLQRALAGTRRPLSERIREMWTDMPPESRAKLPADGASEHDYYIYGSPKTQP